MDEKIREQLDNFQQKIFRLYQDNRCEKGIAIATYAKNLAGEQLGKESPEYAEFLAYLALFYAKKEELAKANSLCSQALKILGVPLTKSSSNFADNLIRLAFLHTASENYAIAELLYLQALEIQRHNLGENNSDFADNLSNLALIYVAQKDYINAEKIYQQAQHIYKSTLGDNHPYVAICLNNRAEMYQAIDQLVEAANCLEQAFKIEVKNEGEDKLEAAFTASNLAEIYRELNRYQKALHYHQQALEIQRQISGEQNSDYATSLNNLGMVYRSLGNYQEAEDLLLQALQIERSNPESCDLDLVPLLNNLVDIKAAAGKYRESEPLLQEILAIQRRNDGENSLDYAYSLNNLAGWYRELGNYSQAEQFYQEAQAIRYRVVGENHLDYAIGLHDLALLYQERGNFLEAERLYQQSQKIRGHILGEDHPDYAVGLSNQGVLYREMGNYAKAKQFQERALEIDRQAGNDKDSEHAIAIYSLAGVYQVMGEYDRAELLYREALALLKNLNMENHPKFAQILSNLAVLHEGVGNYAEAIRLLNQAIAIESQTLGETHPDYASSLSSLAVFYQSAGKYAEAEKILQHAREIWSQTLGENHPRYITALNNLAVLCNQTNKHEEALELYQQALEKTEAAVGKDHPDYAIRLGNLANHHLMLGDYAAAEPLYRQALEIHRAAVGENHSDYAIALGNLAELHAATGRYVEAMALTEEVEAISDRILGQVFSVGPESQRMAYLKKIQRAFDAFVSLISQYLPSSQSAVQAGFNFVLRRKGIGAEALASQRDAVLGGRYPELASKLEELTALRMQIAQKTLAGPQNPRAPQEHQSLLAAWNTEKESLEAELARQIPEMNLQQQLQAIDLHSIAKALPPGAVLVEFVRCRIYDYKAVLGKNELQWKPARYLAFVLKAEEPNSPKMINLGEAEAVEEAIAGFRASIIGQSDRWGEEPNSATDRTDRRGFETVPMALIPGVADSGIALRKKVFDRIAPALGKSKSLFLAPDGDLTKLPFEVLPTDDGRHLIDEYRISYLSTARDILRFQGTTANKYTPPLVAADPDFDLSTSQIATSTSVSSESGRQLSELKFRNLDFKRLPGTKKEGEEIALMLGVEPWLEGMVLESELKKRRSPRILHLATHGFFLKSQSSKPENTKPIQRLSAAELENPLLRSGLALAGANTWLKKNPLPTEAEDGILTAEDVSGLDLLDTELVVLSACETGLGEIRVGEGVFGLRRAFVLAGARTLIMSLWKVPDKQTQELMTDFYSRVLDGQPRADALRSAQLAMKEKYQNPLYWGAFVCQGNPGSLPTIC